MTHPWLFWMTAVAVPVFLIVCWGMDKSDGDSNSFLRVVLRLIGRHFRVAVKIVFWAIVAVAAFFAILGAASEGSSNMHVGGFASRLTRGGSKSNGFDSLMSTVTAPIRWVVESTIGILAVLAILLSVLLMGDGPGDSFLDRGILGECIAHPYVSVPIILALYLVWLVLNAYALAASEMHYPSSVPSHWSGLTDEERARHTRAVVVDRFGWAMKAIVVWAVIVGLIVVLGPAYLAFLVGG
jgi:hypothetical protein